VSGRCIKCLAEEKLFSYMRESFRQEKDTAGLKHRYKVLSSFLESPELQKLCDETERYLAEGQDINVKITLENGKPKYKIQLK
jgi:hypothetical protein